MPFPVHFTTPALLRYQQSACGLNSATNQVSARVDDVTCSECRASAPFLTRLETAGPPAVVVHHASPFIYRTTCGLDRWDDEARAHRTDLVANSLHANVTCPDCRRRLGLDETAGPPAETIRHFADSTTGTWTRCGLNYGRRIVPRTDFWGLVTCPRCLNIHSQEKETDMPDEAAGETANPVPPSQEEITEAHRHDWEMADGPKWPHDCPECIYLGTKYHTATWDLYYCRQGTRPTVLARRGEDGDYESGIEFIDRIPMLALAYVRATLAGLHPGGKE